MNLELKTEFSARIRFATLEDLGVLVDAHIESERESAKHDDEIDVSSLLESGAGYPSAAAVAQWAAFEKAAEAVLRQWAACEGHPAHVAVDFLAEGGALKIYHSLVGDGTGVFDCEGYRALAHLDVEPEEAADSLHHCVKASPALCLFADFTGGGSLEEALRASAYREG